MAADLNECFSAAVRATAAGFCFHRGAIWPGFTVPVIADLAATWGLGYGIPMMIGTTIFAPGYLLALLAGPETRGKQLVAELQIA